MNEEKRMNYLIELANKSNANFINRLKDPNRNFIKDWENSNNIATHKLGYGEIDNKFYVYPEVQEINGKLIDFTKPSYHSFAGFDSAIENKDYIIMPSKEDAELFTKNYKKYYPSFK